MINTPDPGPQMIAPEDDPVGRTIPIPGHWRHERWRGQWIQVRTWDNSITLTVARWSRHLRRTSPDPLNDPGPPPMRYATILMDPLG